MKNLFYLFVVIGLIFTSCKKEETTTEVSSSEATTTEDDGTVTSNDSVIKTVTSESATQTPLVTNANSVMYNGQTNGAGSTVVSPNSYTTTSSTTTPAVTAKGMNPAHGQPGHRCDIDVGAPLNSKPTKPSTAVTTQKMPQTTTKTTTITPEMMNKTVATPSAVPAGIAAPVETAPGMNPPHGQEGHTCSVPVGAPLPKKE